MNPENSGRSQKVVGFFLAAALTMTPGCTLNPFDGESSDSFCVDANHDGICDEDGRPVQGSNNRLYRSGTWWGIGRFWGSGSGSGTNSGVSSGSKSGIGSSSRSSGSSGG